MKVAPPRSVPELHISREPHLHELKCKQPWSYAMKQIWDECESGQEPKQWEECLNFSAWEHFELAQILIERENRKEEKKGWERWQDKERSLCDGGRMSGTWVRKPVRKPWQQYKEGPFQNRNGLQTIFSCLKWDMQAAVFSKISATWYNLFLQDDSGMGKGNRKHGLWPSLCHCHSRDLKKYTQTCTEQRN